MIDKDFYKNHGPLKLRYLAEQIDAEFEGDDEFEIKDIATLKLANSNEISFFVKSETEIPLSIIFPESSSCIKSETVGKNL